ncbi:general transcription factor II-I repeat domain-containing protein 2-like [Trematomus bernacchii]|uniref:general transcription factor II-I repeat domain-containing protein 2-like n=1 Tax=Trematomus bernacchii TaxID=40690 RepID=UPI00146C8FD8|nr:general transcription factor II-I repeat domain-containing protein 2-like [Trematomus bernacchii]
MEADITSHLLHLKLQGNNTVCAFQRKLEVFKSDLQEGLLHFPKLLEQTKGENRPQNHVEFLEKLIENFKTRFDDFRLGKQVLLDTSEMSEFSAEAQHIFPWAASLQSELIDLQENLALKEADCDTPTFWTKMVTAAHFPLLHKMAHSHNVRLNLQV